MLRVTKLSGEFLASFPVSQLSDVKALKQRLHRQHGLPPRFRQRLLYESNVLNDAIKLESVLDLQAAATMTSEGCDDEQRHLAAATKHGSVGEGAEDGLSPPRRRCRQKQRLDASVTPDSMMNLQVLMLPFSEASSDQQQELWRVAGEGLAAEAGGRVLPWLSSSGSVDNRYVCGI